jgi:hypothetical protein
MTGASNVKTWVVVPAAALIVTTVPAVTDPMAWPMQATDVELDHELVKHSATERLAEPVNSCVPKFSPATVTDDLPLGAALSTP